MNRKYFVFLAFIFITQLSLAQQNVKQLFKEFGKVEKVNKTMLGKPGDKSANNFIDVKGIKSASMLNLEDCTQDTKKRFVDAVKQLKDEAYETLIKMEQDGQQVRVLLKMENDKIKEAILLQAGDNCVMVWIKGEIDISALNVIQKKIQ